MVSKVVNDGAINWNKLYISGGVRGVTDEMKKILWWSSYCVDYNVWNKKEMIHSRLCKEWNGWIIQHHKL